MASLPKDMADQAGKARAAGGGNFIQHGNYVNMIKLWHYQQIQDRCIITEMLVGTSQAKVVYEGKKEVRDTPNAPGSDCSEVVNYDGEGKLSAPSNARAVVLGLYGFKQGEIPDTTLSMTLRQVCKEDESDPELAGIPIQPAAGMLIGVSTFPKEIKSRKGEYITGRNWICVDKPGTGVNTPEKVKERLAALARSPEECVRVIQEHLKGAKVDFGEASGVPAGAPAAPNGKPHLVGWSQHQENPLYYFKLATATSPAEVKLETDILAAWTLANKPAIPVAPVAPPIPTAPPVPVAQTPAIPTAPPTVPPIVPTAPPVIPTAPPIAADPMAGWTQHPENPLYYYKNGVNKTEADIRAGR